MEDEFETMLEDGSAEVVARDVVRMWEVIQRGAKEGEEEVRRWEETAEKLKGKKVEVEVTNEAQEVGENGEEGEWEDESDDEDDMDEDEAPQLLQPQAAAKAEPEVDEDGFTLVKGKGKGKSHR